MEWSLRQGFGWAFIAHKSLTRWPTEARKSCIRIRIGFSAPIAAEKDLEASVGGAYNKMIRAASAAMWMLLSET